MAVVSSGCARVWPQMQVQLPGCSGDSSVCQGGWSWVRVSGVMLRDVGDEMWLSPAAKSRPPLVCKRPPGRAQRWEWDLEQPLLWGALGQRSRGCVGTVLLPGGRRGAGLPRCCCIAAPSRERSWEGRGCCIAGLRLELCKWRCVGAAAMLWSGARRALRSTRPSSHLFLPRFVLLECFFHSSRCCLPGPIEAATSFNSGEGLRFLSGRGCWSLAVRPEASPAVTVEGMSTRRAALSPCVPRTVSVLAAV